MNNTVIDEVLFSAEIVEAGIVLVKIKRHLIDHLSLLSHKESFFKFLDRFAGDDSIKCIVILGHPEKRGAAEFEEWHENIKEMSLDSNATQRVVNAFQQHVRRLVVLPQIILYGDAGIMTSNYLSIGLAANYCVLADSVEIQNTNAKYDLLPAGGAAFLLKERIGAQRALALLTTKEVVSAKKAEALGLCDCVCPAEELEACLMKQARMYASHRSTYLRALKKAMMPDLKKLDDWFRHEQHVIIRDTLWD